MATLTWDDTGKRTYHTGTKKGVLYPTDTSGAYGKGIAWSGLTAVTETPSGAEATDLWADDIKYLSVRSTEDFGFTIEAYDYPDEWGECDGSAEAAPGVLLGQQKRKMFGFSFVSTKGNDTEGNDYGYIIHLIYGATASVSERSYATINDSPDAITFSWECSTIPTSIKGHKPAACIRIDSTKVKAGKLTALEKLLYGDESTEPKLPTPDEVIEMFKDVSG